MTRRYFDWRRRTKLRPAQIADRRDFWLEQGAICARKIRLASWHRHAVQQSIGQRATALPGLLNVVSEPMSHDGGPHRLKVFGQHYVASIHHGPGLRRMKQGQPRARRQTAAMALTRS